MKFLFWKLGPIKNIKILMAMRGTTKNNVELKRKLSIY